MKLLDKNNILALFIILSVIFLKMEIHPANRQLQEQKLQQFRYVDLHVMERFASYLRAKEGQKHVFLLYQQENIPLIGDFFDMTSADVEIYDPTRPEGLTIAAHFLYITKPLIDNLDIHRQGSQRGLRHRDITEDVYNAFLRIAKDTGGIIESSANVSSAFQKAAFASENYYLLYYTPKDYKIDGKFRTVKVRVRGQNYRINHRAGYFAD